MLVYRSESCVTAVTRLERVVFGSDFVDEVAADVWNLGEDVPAVLLQLVKAREMRRFRGARLTSLLAGRRRRRRWQRRRQMRRKLLRGYRYNRSKHFSAIGHQTPLRTRKEVFGQ